MRAPKLTCRRGVWDPEACGSLMGGLFGVLRVLCGSPAELCGSPAPPQGVAGYVDAGRFLKSQCHGDSNHRFRYGHPSNRKFMNIENVHITRDVLQTSNLQMLKVLILFWACLKHQAYGF